MTKTSYILILVVVALVPASVRLSAHHTWPVNSARLVTVRGTVTEIAWLNPHPMFTLEVLADDGRVEKWQVGGPAINRMRSNGWDETTIKPGDVITGIGYQYSDGQKIIRLEKVLLPDGREIAVYGRL